MTQPQPYDVIAKLAKEALDNQILRIQELDIRDQGHFHPSSIGYCTRKIILERLGVKKPPHDARVQRIFENGHGVHARIQKELKDAGLLVLDEVPLVSPDHNIAGHTDGIGMVYVPGLGGISFIIEIKSASQKSYDWIVGSTSYKRHGVDPKHNQQVQLYMYMSGLSYALVIYECKNDQRREYFVVKRDNDLINNVLLPKVDLVNAHVLAGTLPPRDVEHLDPNPQTGKSPFECLTCQYLNACRAEEFRRSNGQEVDLLAIGETTCTL